MSQLHISFHIDNYDKKLLTFASESIPCAVYTYNTKSGLCNIGDYIQSIAAKQFCPNPVLIDRDGVETYNGSYVRLIANGWHQIQSGNRFYAKNINPLLISYHAKPDSVYHPLWLDYLKTYNSFKGPVGCRDQHTNLSLSSYGINTFFSRCATLTLGQQYHYSGIRKNVMICVDVDPAMVERFIQMHPFVAKFERVYLTHGNCEDHPETENFAQAEKYLREYSMASLVLSSRLHVVLPCIAMQTPSVLIRHSFDTRFSGLLQYVNYWEHYGDKIIKVQRTNGVVSIVNPPMNQSIIDDLVNTISSFVMAPNHPLFQAVN